MPLPGADDDGSGSVTILESYRALIASNFRPERPVEFHWYSAEVSIVNPARPSKIPSEDCLSGRRPARISSSCQSL
jgi:hypothetical protein